MRAAAVQPNDVAGSSLPHLISGKVPITIEQSGTWMHSTNENVIGLMEGSDPVLKNEYLVIGGHLDHWGLQHGNEFPGADDNGSGATDVIEIAKAIAANPNKPRRSILFVTFFGEEQRHLGSIYFVTHPPVPLAKIVAEMQLDMVGRDSDGDQQDRQQKRIDRASKNADTIRPIGSKRISSEMDRYVQTTNKYVNFHLLYDTESVYGRSDDFTFAQMGMPTVWLFSGFHPDYHEPTDTVEKIDWIKLTNTAKLLYLTAHAIGDADSVQKKDVQPAVN